MKRYLVLLLAIGLLATAAEAKKWRAKHVVVIGIDGWGAYSVPKAQDIPNIRSLMDGGCYSLTKRSVLPSSSAINWASMFNGAPTEMHGYTQWGSKRPDIPSMTTNSHGIFPTVFSILREQYPDVVTACIAEWDGIKHLVDTLAINNYDVATNYKNDDEQLTRMAEEYIRTKRPTLMAVCYDQVDHVGHHVGHDTPDYYKVLSHIDRQVGRIVQALKDAGIYDDTVILITADHGGKEKGHGGQSLLEMEIPFIICGKGIKRLGKIDDVIMQYDTAATIAEIFRLKRPQAWRGVPIWSVFR